MVGQKLFQKEGVQGKLKRAKDKVVEGIKPNFWKEVILTLNPKNYSHLPSRGVKRAFGHLLAVLLASFVIMSIVALPNIIDLPEDIKGELSKFEKLNITIDVEMSSPVKIKGGDPQIIVDTTGAFTELGSEKLLITEDNIFFRPYAMTRTYNLSEFKDLTTKKDELSTVLTLLAIILIPTVLITSFAMLLIKYIITILAASILLFVLARLIKKDIGFGKSVNIALFASTPMILVEVIFIPFNSKYLIPIFQLMGMNFYLITLFIYLSLMLFGSYFAARQKGGKIEWGF